MSDLDSFFEFSITEGSAHSELAHHSVVDHKPSRITNTLLLIFAAWLMIFGHGDCFEISKRRMRGSVNGGWGRGGSDYLQSNERESPTLAQ
jgi:hypothetical protein